MIRAAAFSLLLLAGCATAPPMNLEAPSGEWELEALAGGPTDAPRKPTVTFEGARVSGFAGCNRWFGQISQEQQADAYFGAVGSTRMACPGAAMAMEQAFLAGVSRTRAVRVEDGKLRFFDEGDAEIMRFRPAAESAG